jgi:hypothetical protein
MGRSPAAIQAQHIAAVELRRPGSFSALPEPAAGEQPAISKEANMNEPTITHLERRRIEAGVLIPMVQAFQKALGKERANAVVRDVILEFARADGARWAERFGDDLTGLEQVADIWAAGGALEVSDKQRSESELSFNVKRCGYAQLYQELGLAELGFLVHCSRDFAMAESFSPDLALTRTQTIMQGAGHCDFHYERKGGSGATGRPASDR